MLLVSGTLTCYPPHCLGPLANLVCAFFHPFIKFDAGLGVEHSFFFPASVRRQTIAHLLPGLLSESSDQCWGLQLAERDKRICPQPSTSCWFHPRPSIAELKTSAFVLLRVPLFNLWKYMLFEIGISRNWGLADMGSFQTLLNNVTLVVFN